VENVEEDREMDRCHVNAALTEWKARPARGDRFYFFVSNLRAAWSSLRFAASTFG
jgi:hypothetical protein